MRELQLALIVLSGVVWREGRADADRDVLTPPRTQLLGLNDCPQSYATHDDTRKP